jgi:hypothetical protein
VGTKFSATVQTGPGAHPAFYTTDTGSFPGVKRPGRGVDHPPHLAPRLKKEKGYTATPSWLFVAFFRVNFAFTFTFIIVINRGCVLCEAQLKIYMSFKRKSAYKGLMHCIVQD